jgi:hypothetical protein
MPLQGELLMLKRSPTIEGFRNAVKVNKGQLMAEVHGFTGFFYDPPGGLPPGPRGAAAGCPGKTSGVVDTGGSSGTGWVSGVEASGGETTGPATTGGGVTAPMRRITIFCRRVRRGVGCAGFITCGFAIAAASNAASDAERSLAGL